MKDYESAPNEPCVASFIDAILLASSELITRSP